MCQRGNEGHLPLLLSLYSPFPITTVLPFFLSLSCRNPSLTSLLCVSHTFSAIVSSPLPPQSFTHYLSSLHSSLSYTFLSLCLLFCDASLFLNHFLSLFPLLSFLTLFSVLSLFAYCPLPPLIVSLALSFSLSSLSSIFEVHTRINCPLLVHVHTVDSASH